MKSVTERNSMSCAYAYVTGNYMTVLCSHLRVSWQKDQPEGNPIKYNVTKVTSYVRSEFSGS